MLFAVLVSRLNSSPRGVNIPLMLASAALVSSAAASCRSNRLPLTRTRNPSRQTNDLLQQTYIIIIDVTRLKQYLADLQILAVVTGAGAQGKSCHFTLESQNEVVGLCMVRFVHAWQCAVAVLGLGRVGHGLSTRSTGPPAEN